MSAAESSSHHKHLSHQQATSPPTPAPAAPAAPAPAAQSHTDYFHDSRATTTRTTNSPLHHFNNQQMQYKLKGLYDYLKEHPALMDRRLYMGSQKPEESSTITQVFSFKMLL